ncbi:MAG: EamA family transporter [Terriglobales bacterium]
MHLSFQIAPFAFSLAAVACWGASDFIGGYASRSANAFLITAIAHGSGLLFVTALAIAQHSVLPSHRSLAWALAAGLSGGAALALFYRALSTGRMGLAAPVSAVVGAAIPTAFAIFFEGLPHPIQIAGFLLAGLGIWLVSRPDDAGAPDNIGLALAAGIGFAGFFLCIKQAGNGSAFWIAAASRAASLLLTGAIVLLWQTFRDADRFRVQLAALAGCLDVSGSVLFIRASQAGRLDEAVVLTSLYPVVTVLLARFFLRERFTRWKAIGVLAALLAVPMISIK